MRTSIRTVSAFVLSAGVLSGCVTKKTFRREITAVQTSVTSERTARIAADSGLAADIATLRTDLQNLRTEFGARITAMEQGMQFAFPVNFAFDDASVQAENQAALTRFAQVAQKYYPGAVITVEGFADPAGAARYNQQLSARRAESVKAYLTSQGLDGSLLKTVGYGENRQVVPGAQRDDQGADQNRRVVFVIESRGTGTAAAPVTSTN
jgi:peptidoglycan-associated lipoprotein